MPKLPFVSPQKLTELRAWAIRIAPFVLIVLAAFVLWRAVHGLSPGQILAAIGRWSVARIATALGLVVGRQLSSDNPQRAIGLMTASFALGQMIGPTAAGFLFDSLGSLRIPSLLAAGALVVAGGLAVAAGRAVAADVPDRTSIGSEAEP